MPGKLKPILRVIPPFVLFLLVFSTVAFARPQAGACELPEALQSQIAAKYPGTELVTLSSLDADDRESFQKDHGPCPGLVRVDFYGDGNPTLALVLIAEGEANEEAKLLVARQIKGRWQMTVLDTAQKGSTPVVGSLPAGHYTDVYGNKQIDAKRPVIVFAGYDSWSILYAWTGRRVTKIWLQD